MGVSVVGGLAAIKARQYERTTTVTPAIHTCFEVLLAVIRSPSLRCYLISIALLRMLPWRYQEQAQEASSWYGLDLHLNFEKVLLQTFHLKCMTFGHP